MDGKVVIPPKFPSASGVNYGLFTEGLAPVIKYDEKIENPMYAFINTKGEFVIPYQKGEANNFSCGMALVKIDEKNRIHYFYINQKGQTVLDLPKDYESPGNFINGLTQVFINGELKQINKKGQVVIPH